ncbi:N-acyl homoserine lactonase family protein [Pseudarthrobacter niigatensis]|uniref:Glyoxylase-like metal-dependent hydrolase (Beta-lactamase superfamily II) n=1 Tax=Pseudarthrobacter niigatensis TaxID=369935 RepID=A0AAJ1WE65_9MICC|nr:N-acyl homoserine lactonase family protein [Pseudarthrobacter niigatensis]MDQ0144657.1 glyoxylase-like metal-dependent hydrolase (beta-lactamase superfamily II) [Pseudarthrobacter niigatensis]MDQ0265303.1 glyoxylase-like metal-dependent hydrolase (beta-lactamase superfamily II) [Pseudarthrobacter niigatensis]
MPSAAATHQTWEVIAVRHGRLLTTRGDFYLNYSGYGQPDGPLELAYWIWILRSGSRTIVVDTGYSSDGAQRRGREVLIPPSEALEALGISPDSDVDLVVTHAHYDHIGNLDLFPSQPVYLHPAETAFWLGPDSCHSEFQAVVDDADLARLRQVAESDRVVWVDAPREIAPGVTVVPFVGHTPGQLVVVIETAAGRVVLSSDACHLTEELEADMPFKHNTDLIGLFRGLAKLREWQGQGAIVVPGHEPSVLGNFPPVEGALAGHAVRIG